VGVVLPAIDVLLIVRCEVAAVFVAKVKVLTAVVVMIGMVAITVVIVPLALCNTR